MRAGTTTYGLMLCGCPLLVESGEPAGQASFLAAERTYLASVRTALALLGFGLVLAKVSKHKFRFFRHRLKVREIARDLDKPFSNLNFNISATLCTPAGRHTSRGMCDVRRLYQNIGALKPQKDKVSPEQASGLNPPINGEMGAEAMHGSWM